MKIIKEGKLPGKYWLGKCDYCGCVVEFEEKEGKYDRREDYCTIACPTCDTTIYGYRGEAS